LHAGTRPLILLLLLAAAPPARAQGFLDEFSYEGLRFAGFGIDVGGTWSDRLEAAVSGSVRIDAGFIAPRVRTLLSAGLLLSRYGEDEITELEERLTAVVDDPTGDATVAIDSITLTNLSLDLDLQYLFLTGRVMPYAGLGLGIHLRNAGGAAIEETIVEDALEAIVAAVNGSAGVEVRLTEQFGLTGEVRGTAASGLLAWSARAGMMVRFPGRGGS
jgi:hypothetical protein